MIVTPEWLRIAKPDAMLSSKEVARLFNSTPKNISSLTHKGLFPKPDNRVLSEVRAPNGARAYKVFWRKDTIMTEIKRRNALEVQPKRPDHAGL